METALNIAAFVLVVYGWMWAVVLIGRWTGYDDPR